MVVCIHDFVKDLTIVVRHNLLFAQEELSKSIEKPLILVLILCLMFGKPYDEWLHGPPRVIIIHTH